MSEITIIIINKIKDNLSFITQIKTNIILKTKINSIIEKLRKMIGIWSIENMIKSIVKIFHLIPIPLIAIPLQVEAVNTQVKMFRFRLTCVT